MLIYKSDIQNEKELNVKEVKDVDNVLKNYRSYTICSDGNGIAYVNDFATFDIETTSMSNYGFMYVAMFCIGEDVFFMRRWEEFQLFINKLASFYKTTLKKRYVIYVHFLSFEFQFMRAFLDIESIFALKERVVLKVVTKNGLEFRCSYKLFNMSLAKVTETVPGVIHKKLDGEKFDYSEVRTCETKLDYYEASYAYNDVKGLHEAIEYKLKDDSLATIPLTSTGYVRRDCRNAFLSNPANRSIILDGEIDSYIYLLLRTMRRGGDTSCNICFNDEILENVVSFDKRSSYPYEMLTKKFPHGQWVKDSGNNIDSENRAYIIVLELTDIVVKDSSIIGYIPVAKTLSKSGWVNANGRIVKADYVKLIVNELDLDIIEQRYEIKGEKKIVECYSCEKKMLPRELREQIILYYANKTDLEEVDIYLYARSKELLNAIFGMMLTDITHAEYFLENGEWKKEIGDIAAKLAKYFKSRNSFLLYQWGVWVTSYARHGLNEPYIHIYKEAIYNDTDSWKCFNTDKVRKVFKRINQRIESEVTQYDIQPSYKNHTLGVWVNEGVSEQFKTLGSKKYIELKNGEMKVTVAGLNKKKGAEYIKKKGGITAFKDGLQFPEEFSGRTVSVYDDNDTIRKIKVKGVEFITASSIAIHSTTYTLDRTGDYLNLVKEIKKYGLSNIS